MARVFLYAVAVLVGIGLYFALEPILKNQSLSAAISAVVAVLVVVELEKQIFPTRLARR